jgi:hypothetical protein
MGRLKGFTIKLILILRIKQIRSDVLKGTPNRKEVRFWRDK